MSQPEFYPAPSQPPRSLLRWLVLLLHGSVFALTVGLYPTLVDAMPFFASNSAKIILPVWGGVVVLHLVLLALWDTIEGMVQTRRENKRRQEYHRMKNYRRMLDQFSGQPEPPYPPEA